MQFGLKYNVEKNVDGILKLGNEVQLKHVSELIREKTFSFFTSFILISWTRKVFVSVNLNRQEPLGKIFLSKSATLCSRSNQQVYMNMSANLGVKQQEKELLFFASNCFNQFFNWARIEWEEESEIQNRPNKQ